MSEEQERQNVTSEKSPQDFYQNVLHSFEKDYNAEDLAEKQQNWQKFAEKPKRPRKNNDFPNYFFAGFWIRTFAYVIDILCIQALTTIFLGSLFNLLQWDRSNHFFSAYGLLSLGIYLGYFTLMTKLNRGQTIGKMIFGIRVVCFNEEELSWPTVLIRETACRFILQVHPLCLLGFLPSAFTAKKQHVADYFSETSVVTLNMIHAFNHQAQV